MKHCDVYCYVIKRDDSPGLRKKQTNFDPTSAAELRLLANEDPEVVVVIVTYPDLRGVAHQVWVATRSYLPGSEGHVIHRGRVLPDWSEAFVDLEIWLKDRVRDDD